MKNQDDEQCSCRATHTRECPNVAGTPVRRCRRAPRRGAARQASQAGVSAAWLHTLCSSHDGRRGARVFAVPPSRRALPRFLTVIAYVPAGSLHLPAVGLGPRAGRATCWSRTGGTDARGRHVARQGDGRFVLRGTRPRDDGVPEASRAFSSPPPPAPFLRWWGDGGAVPPWWAGPSTVSWGWLPQRRSGSDARRRHR